MATTIEPTRVWRQAGFAALVLLAMPSAALMRSPSLWAGTGVTAQEKPAWEKFGRDLYQIAEVGPKGEGSAAAVDAVRRLSTAKPQDLPMMLAWFSAVSPVGRNLLAGAVQATADGLDPPAVADAASTALSRGVGMRRAGKNQFTGDIDLHPEAAALAFRLLEDADPNAAAAYLAEQGLTSDAPPVRRAAVAARLEDLSGDASADELRALLDRTLDADQVETLADRLAELDEPVDLPRQFGFLTDWRMAGPFDHRDDQAFDATLPPEETPGDVDFAATFPTAFPGVGETVGWREISTDDDFGVVSVADSFENWKGSAVVLARTFQSPAAGPAAFRIGTPNAFKLYLNGELLFARPEYHRGTKMDQYVIPAELEAGENVLMLKLCQNQQEQGWAQRYQVQLRVTDPTGSALREPKAAE